MTTTTASAAAPKRVTPTATQAVRISWGDLLDQIVEHETPIIESIAGAGATLALAHVPMGALISAFIGPTVIQQYVDTGLATLEATLKGQSTTITPSNAIEAYVLAQIKAYEPALVAHLGPQLDALLKATIAKVGIAA